METRHGNIRTLGARGITPELLLHDASQAKFKTLVLMGVTTDGEPVLMASNQGLQDLLFLSKYLELFVNQELAKALQDNQKL